jgi:nucleoid DNA-binding protein
MMAEGAKPKPMSKTEMYKAIADASGVDKKHVVSVLTGLSDVIARNIGKKGPGVVAIPGLVKIVVVHKKAQPARKGVPNPFRPGELMDVAAKPASKKVKVQALKALKDIVK